MSKFVVGLAGAVLVAGCTTTGEPLTGTALTTDEKGHSRMVTYVTMEEYQRMSLEERQRLNATVGSSARVFGSPKHESKPVTARDLDKHYSRGR